MTITIETDIRCDYSKIMDIFGEKQVTYAELKLYDLLFIILEEDSYEGSVTVIFKHGEKLMGVFSTHCSCDGFTWEPEEVTMEQLQEILPNSIKVIESELLQFIKH